jgi:hypothetical protein
LATAALVLVHLIRGIPEAGVARYACSFARLASACAIAVAALLFSHCLCSFYLFLILSRTSGWKCYDVEMECV